MHKKILGTLLEPQKDKVCLKYNQCRAGKIALPLLSWVFLGLVPWKWFMETTS